MECVVILCDLNASQRVPDPKALRRRLDDLLDHLNREHRDRLLMPWTRLKGIDEFGCVARPGQWTPMLPDAWMALHPHAVRTVAVQGTLQDTGAARSLRDAYGDAVHRAAQAMQESHREGSLVRVDTGNPHEDQHVGDTAHLLYSTLLAWTPRRLEYFRAYLPDRTQSQVAEDLGISQPTVASALSKMNARYFRTILLRWARGDHDSHD